jgi:hypothetical protein
MANQKVFSTRTDVFDIASKDEYQQWLDQMRQDGWLVKLYKDNYVPFSSYDLQIEPKQITITTKTPNVMGVTNIGEQKTIITWDDFKNHSTYSGFDRWIVNATPEGKHEPFFNIYPLTSELKMSTIDYIKFSSSQTTNKFWNMFTQIFTVAEADDFNGCFFIINVNEGCEVTCNKSIYFEEKRIDISQPAYKAKRYYYPKLGARIASLSADGAQIIVGLPNEAEAEIYISVDHGVAPRKVSLSKGRGTFNFSSVGMSSGDKATIKLGFKWFSGLVALEYTKP